MDLSHYGVGSVYGSFTTFCNVHLCQVANKSIESAVKFFVETVERRVEVTEVLKVPKVWRETHKIASYQVGSNSLVTTQSMCRLLQEVAVNHAALMNVAAEEIARNDLMWVLARLRLQMRNMPAWHDEIMIETWGTDRSNVASAHRDFRIMNAKGNEIGQSSSIWMLLGMRDRLTGENTGLPVSQQTARTSRRSFEKIQA